MSRHNIDNPKHFRELIDEIEGLWKLYDGRKETAEFRIITLQTLTVRTELEDLDLIWQRFLRARAKLLALDPRLSKSLLDEKFESSKHAYLSRIQRSTLAQLRADLKSLFLFSDILFNKLVLLIRSVFGPTRRVKHESFSSFLKSIRSLDDKALRETRLYEKVGEQFERIDVLMGFYRDKFIVHPLGPYQESIIRGVYQPDFVVDHSSDNLEKFDLPRFRDLIKELHGILPTHDRYGKPLGDTGDPRLKVEVLFYNLHKIKDAGLRERAEGFIRSIGIRTPDVYYLVKTVKSAVLGTVEILRSELSSKFAS